MVVCVFWPVALLSTRCSSRMLVAVTLLVC
jgi:hypothetical protein